MSAKNLMDSRRFCLLMDDLAVTWKKRGATDEDKEFRLEAVRLHILSQAPSEQKNVPLTVSYTPQKPGPIPADMPDSQDVEELAELMKSIETEADPQVAVDKAVLEVIKKNWPGTDKGGFNCFTVKTIRDGVQLSMDPERWKNALAKNKLPSGVVNFSLGGFSADNGRQPIRSFEIQIA